MLTVQITFKFKTVCQHQKKKKNQRRDTHSEDFWARKSEVKTNHFVPFSANSSSGFVAPIK